MSLIKLEQVRWTGQPRRIEAATPATPAAAPKPVATAVAPAAALVPAAQLELQRLRAELSAQQAAHQAELEQLRAQARAALEQATASAHAEGVDQGLAMAGRSDDAQATALREGMARLQLSQGDTRQTLEALAVGVARLALRALLGNADWRAEALAQAVARMAGALLPEAPAVVRVSALDFADLGPLRATLAAPGLAACTFEVLADPGLQAGACLVEVADTLVDVSLQRQLQRVEALLVAEVLHG
jgi:type III secretion protein L